MSPQRNFLAAVLLLALTGCGEVRLYSNLPESEVNQMFAILQTHGIDCTKVEGDEGKWHLTVPQEPYADAVAILEETGHPRRAHPTMQDLFPKSGFTSSPSEQKIRLRYGIEESLASTIEALPGGIIRADVHISLPDNQPLREDAQPSRANVVVTHRSNADIEYAAVTIPQIVMGAIDGLTADDVGVQLVEAEDSLLADRVKLATSDKSAQLTQILSISVAKDSVPRLIGVLVVAGLAVLTSLILAVQKFTSRAARAASS